jgi:hypothetical protein
MPFPPPRKIKAPLFGSAEVPNGRLEDIYKELPADVRDLVAIRSAGRRWDSGYWLYKFNSEEHLKEELLIDAGRCPAEMGGGTKGWGTAQIGWKRLSNYKR